MHPSALPKAEVMGMSDPDLLRWAAKVCPAVKFGKDDVDAVRDTVKKSYRPVAEMSLKQPFPVNFGLGQNGKPNKAFREFLDDDATKHKLFEEMTMVFGNPAIINRVLDDVVGKNKVCSQLLILVTHTPKEVKKLHLPYEKELLLRKGKLEPHTRLFYFTSQFLGPKTYKGTTLDDRDLLGEFNNAGKKFPSFIKGCKQPYISVSVAYYARRIPPLDELFAWPQKGLIGHATRVLINTRTTPATLTLVESSSGTKWWEDVLKKDLSIIISNALGREAQFEDESCDTVLQGNSQLCATWSIYLLLLNLLNPKANVTDTLSKYAQKDRDRLILRFGYFMKKYVSLSGPALRGDRLIPGW